MVADNETPPSLVAEKEMPYDMTPSEGQPVPFKQTEVGLGPNDWEVKTLGEVLLFQRGYDLPNRLRIVGEIPIISSAGVLGMHNVPAAIGPGVITGRYGTIGQVFYTEQDYWPLNTTLFVKDFRGNHPLYIFHLLKTVDFESYSGKSGVPGVNRNDLHHIEVVTPRTLAEQRSIATALSDVDELLTSLDALIAKKRAIKQGAMQQLLTGKTRLPGSSGEWETIELDKIAELRKEKIDPRRDPKSEFCIELEHIESNSGRLNGFTKTTEFSSIKSVFHPDDVLFGKLRSYLRKYWYATREGVCSTEVWVFTSRPVTEPRYLFQLLQSDSFIEITSIGYGTHMPRADWNIVRKHEFLIPPTLAEQQAIAQILSEMDSEVEELENQRNKYRALKQGMMQQLLTGKIRIVAGSRIE